MPQQRPPTREEFNSLGETVKDLLRESQELKALLTINTDLTSDIRALIRSSSIVIGFIKTVGICSGALAAVYAAWHAVQQFIKG